MLDPNWQCRNCKRRRKDGAVIRYRQSWCNACYNTWRKSKRELEERKANYRNPPTPRICKKCGAEKPASEFRLYSYTCNQCANRLKREKRHAAGAAVRRSKQMKKFGELE